MPRARPPARGLRPAGLVATATTAVARAARARLADTGPMISLELARALQEAGLRWRPAPGDRFSIDQPALAGDVFTISEMTVEARTYPTGTILGFNGTTEWALDSVTLDQTVWRPREDQLRDLLGATFRRLEREADGYRVRATFPAGPGTEEVEHAAPEPADAYGAALLDLIGRSSL